MKVQTLLLTPEKMAREVATSREIATSRELIADSREVTKGWKALRQFASSGLSYNALTIPNMKTVLNSLGKSLTVQFVHNFESNNGHIGSSGLFGATNTTWPDSDGKYKGLLFGASFYISNDYVAHSNRFVYNNVHWSYTNKNRYVLYTVIIDSTSKIYVNDTIQTVTQGDTFVGDNMNLLNDPDFILMTSGLYATNYHLAHLSFWNKALSAAEVSETYETIMKNHESLDPDDYPNLVCYFPMQEGTGTVTDIVGGKTGTINATYGSWLNYLNTRETA